MTLSAFLAVIILLAIGFVILYVLSIYLKYREVLIQDAVGTPFCEFFSIRGTMVGFLSFPGSSRNWKDISTAYEYLSSKVRWIDYGDRYSDDSLKPGFMFLNRRITAGSLVMRRGETGLGSRRTSKKNHFYNPV